VLEPSLPRGEEKVGAVDAMFDAIAPRYDLVNRVMTFGLDVRWRRRTVRALGLPPGARVADIACGTGDLSDELVVAGLRPVGVDRSHGMLTAAHTDAPLVRGDALGLPFPDASLDGVVSGFALRNFAALEPFFSECARVLRPGGRLSILEVSAPRGGIARRVHGLWFEKAVPLIGGALSDRSAYRYLPRSVAYLPPDEAIVEELRAVGFADARRQALTQGAVQLLTGTRA